MQEKRLHIVAFDVPYPPNYGGIIDVFYRLRSLHEAGARIIFHCFYYSGHNKPTEELSRYCEQIHYYRRPKNIFKLIFSEKPYIVSSRKDKKLLQNLLATDAPILFDGLHTCFYLSHPALKTRKKYVRAHNLEHTYYRELSSVERNRFKRWYLDREAGRLALFEPVLKQADGIFCVAKMDMEHFSEYTKTIHLPPFYNTDHARHDVNKSGVQGKFILYHGNLRIRENELAAKFIINEIAPLVKHRIVIAGKSPTTWLKNEASIQDNIQMIDTPSSVQMDSLIQYAQVNLLITFQQTGVKLKLLHALDAGKHIIINSDMDDAGIFTDFCYVKNSPSEIAKKIDDLMKIEFTEQMVSERKLAFKELFDNGKNARRILNEIFGETT